MKIYLKTSLNNKKLNIPLHFISEFEDDEWIITCLEIPQVYGSNKIEKEAMEMIDRNILLLFNDLHDGSKYSTEFEALKKFLDLIFGE